MGKPMITSDDLVEFDLDAYPIWTCTNRLRWRVTDLVRLQQLWECSNGNTEWRSVEFVS